MKLNRILKIEITSGLAVFKWILKKLKFDASNIKKTIIGMLNIEIKTFLFLVLMAKGVPTKTENKYK